MGEWSFGVSFGFLSAGEDIHNLINTLDKRSDVINALGHLPLFLRPYMKYFILDPFWYKGLRVLSNLGAVATSAFRKRLAKAERGEDLKRKDLMGFLLAAKDPDTGGPLRQQEILAEAISSIGGGSHTTSLTMTHFMDFVSRDQELQEEMWKELCDAFPGPVGVDWVASEEVAEKLPLLNAVIKEAMRIRPATSTGLERVVPEGGRIVGDIFLPGGSLVSVPIVVIHNDGSIYEANILSSILLVYPNTSQNPEKFDPHRWLRPKAKELSDCYIPFSLGSRACAGRVYVMNSGLEIREDTDSKQVCNDGDVQDSCDDFSSIQVRAHDRRPVGGERGIRG